MDKTTDYIFSINTGRSGSQYLKTLFDHVAGCQAFHESQPIGNGRAMRHYAKGHQGLMKELAQEKALRIETIKRDCDVYVETNHCFIKGFGWILPQYIPQDRMGVIVLKRDPSKIARSLLRIGCSPLMPFGRHWITTPDKRNSLVVPPAVLGSPTVSYTVSLGVSFVYEIARRLFTKVFRVKLQPPHWLANYEFDCLLWYVHETAAQAAAFKARFPRIKYYEVDIEELNSLEQVHKMLAFFGCRGAESLSAVVGVPTNLKRPASEKSTQRAEVDVHRS